jgi:hypothetical protein
VSGFTQLVRVLVPSGTVRDSEGRATTTYTETVVRGQIGPEARIQYPFGDQVGAMGETATATGRLPRGTQVTRGTVLVVEGRHGSGTYKVTAHQEDRRGVYVRAVDQADEA